MLDHLSVSQLNSFARCEFQWFLHYVEGLPIVPNAAMVRGKAVHNGLSEVFTQLMHKQEVNRQQVLEAALGSVNDADKEQEVDWNKPKSLIFQQVNKLITYALDSSFVSSINPEEIQSVESRFEHVLFTEMGEEFKIVGYPDLVLSNSIVDFKTSTRTPSSVPGNYVFQLAFYAAVLNRDKCQVDYLIAKKQPAYKKLELDISRELKTSATLIFIKTYKRIKQALARGNFLPNGIFHPWACKTCNYAKQGNCPYYLKHIA